MPDLTQIHIQIDKQIWTEFREKSDALNIRSAELVRKMISAFNDGRMTITPSLEEQLFFNFEKKE